MGCEGHACVAGPPMGWHGPIDLYTGPPEGAPACPAGRLLSAYRDPVNEPAQCSACSVGAPYGFWCFAQVVGYGDDSCSGAGMDSIFFGLDYCNDIGQSSDVAVVGVEPPQGSFRCDPSPQTPTVPPVRWGTAAVGCAGASALSGCGAGESCLAAGGQHCIFTSGNSSCPAGPFSVKSTYYSSALDQRGCTPCGYVASPLACSATALLYSDGSCTQVAATVSDFSGGCTPLSSAFRASKLVNATYQGTPSCAPAGGEPNGGIAVAGPVTVCCAP